MSLLKAFISRYDNDVDAAAVALRTAAGTNKAWAGVAPQSTELPYLNVNHISTALASDRKTQDKRVEEAEIQIDVWSNNFATAESIADLVENAYIGKILTLTNDKRHLSTSFKQRNPENSSQGLWRVIIQFKVMVEK